MATVKQTPRKVTGKQTPRTATTPRKSNASKATEKPPFCKTHPQKALELHCKDCKELTCTNCVTHHASHRIESIDDALKQLLPTATERKRQTEAILKERKLVLEKTNATKAKIVAGYATTEAAIERQYDAIVERARDDSEKVKEKLETVKQRQIAEIDDNIKEIEDQISKEQSAIQQCEQALVKSHGANTLQALVAGLSENLETLATKSTKSKPYAKTVFAEFTAAKVSSSTYIGGITSAVRMESSIPRSLSKLPPSKLLNDRNLGFKSICVAYINNQLWFPELDTDNIHIYTKTGKSMRTIQVPKSGSCRSVVRAQFGVVISAKNGLFLTDFQGNNARQLKDGDYCDASVYNDTIYALDDGYHKIRVFNNSHSHKIFEHTDSLTLKNYKPDSWNTVQVTHDGIYIGQNDPTSNLIQKYTHSGTLRATFGQLNVPRLCGSDTDGNILFADSWNHRLMILDPAGKMAELKIEQLGQCPQSVAVTGAEMFVLKSTEQSLRGLYATEDKSVLKRFSFA